MKPTEADIQAELDRHGMGFVVTETFSNSHTVLWYQIESENLHCQVLFFESYFKITDTESGEFIKFPISSKIEPNDEVLCHLPDKKEIFDLCRSIVRLITGEQVEQTLEEKVREWSKGLEGFYEYSTHDDHVEVRVVDLHYWIYPDRIQWAAVKDKHYGPTYTAEIKTYGIPNDPWVIFAKKVAAALLTEQPEQTLEEAVRGILKPCGKLTVSYIRDDEVSLSSPVHQYWITAESVTYSTGDRGEIHSSVTEYARNGIYKSEFKAIASLLSTRSTKPSYSDLEQRVDELEKGAIRYEERIVTHAGTIKTLEKDVERLERENASLLDKFGPIDQAEQQVAEVETRFQKLAKRAERIADLLIQLNEEIL